MKKREMPKVRLRLEEIRKSFGFTTMKQIANHLGIDISECWRYEKGEVLPGLQMLVHFAQKLNVRIEDLVEYEGKKK